jgi:hypothetical protein
MDYLRRTWQENGHSSVPSNLVFTFETGESESALAEVSAHHSAIQYL